MTAVPTNADRYEQSLARVIGWVRDHRYMGYEPADGNSSALFSLTGGRLLPMRLLQQVVLRSPLNIRPLLRVAPKESPIGRGYMAWGYLTMYRRRQVQYIRQEAAACLAALIANRAERQEFCWGDPYEYATRGGRRPRGEPLLIWSALIGQAFVDAFDVLGDDAYLSVAQSAARWILSLPRENTNSGSCLSYVGYRQSSIHNANAAGAALLARVGALSGDRHMLDVAHSAMLYTCVRQRGDGSWLYGEDPKWHWVDNFHTGYVISALKTYREAANDPTFDAHLTKGAHYFRVRFFESDGRPKYFHDRTYPLDIQCAAQAIDTLSQLSCEDATALDEATRVANWTIARLQSPDGHFCYRDLGWTRVSTPMLHWGQATMVKALATLLYAMDRRG